MVADSAGSEWALSQCLGIPDNRKVTRHTSVGHTCEFLAGLSEQVKSTRALSILLPVANQVREKADGKDGRHDNHVGNH
jgi:hypothetical protein